MAFPFPIERLPTLALAVTLPLVTEPLAPPPNEVLALLGP